MVRFCMAMLLFVPISATAEVDAHSALAKYKKLTSVVPRCNSSARDDAITVCANREADRYRVPFVGYVAGDPRAEGFWGEKQRLQHKTTQCQDRGPFLIGCGSVGVTVGVGLDGAGLKWRKRAD
jgi:hypothetical protein